MSAAFRNYPVLSAFCLTAAMLFCSSPAMPAVQAKPVPLQAAVFAKKLTKNQAPIDPSSAYYPGDTICLSLKFKGRPQRGVAAAKFYLNDQLISQAKVDLATVNKGVFLSIGQSTYAGFTLRPKSPFPISENYRVETTFDGSRLGTYRFKVVPPVDAIPSRITQVTMAKGADEDRLPVNTATVFSAEESVFLAVAADIGTQSDVEVNWYVNGKLDSEGTKSISASTNIPDTHFYFSFRPAGGWKPGKQEVALRMNDKEIGRYAFTIK